MKQVSNALLNLGIKPQEKIAVFSQNCIQYLYTDFGAYGIRVVSIPFYATSSESQIQYMINDAEVKYLFVGEQDQYDKAHRIFPLCPSLERIIIFDESVRVSSHDPNAIYFEDFLRLGEGLPRQTEVEKRWAEANEDDVCNILYTSGTTGASKGVILNYRQYNAAIIANGKCVASPTRTALSISCLSHMCLSVDGRICVFPWVPNSSSILIQRKSKTPCARQIGRAHV